MIRAYAKSAKAAAIAALILMGGCSHPQSIHSQAMPGTQVLTFPNSPDRSWYTYIESNAAAQQGGVGARTIDIGVSNGSQAIDQLAIDFNGNVGIRGTLSSPSTKRAKKDIAPLKVDPLALLRGVRFVTYRYKWEPERGEVHYGFIAEDTPAQFSGSEHNSFEVNNSLAINMAATKELDQRIRDLEREVNTLKATLARKKNR